MISTHTPLAGRDVSLNIFVGSHIISTHTPLAGRDLDDSVPKLNELISTHTPLAGRDVIVVYGFLQCSYFNSHAPRGA